ncbi:MAG: endonuclease domain-containing protein [Candidatus Peribacteraceae bacterium]|nr:endonuclease domain-containing protein [Candidatus Peribacteraceae bacterium]MDD5742400.1 endonuclease domain-containing protein [Candidatus Peribacteraceae bacterium]
MLYARRLRKRMTRTEIILWEALRNRKCAGLKFCRQFPLEWFVVDFFCVERSVIIEIDGPIHEQQRVYDQERDEILRQKQLRILRLTNDQIVDDLPFVLQMIKNFCALPLPRGERSGKGEGVGG